jgi:asparagine synthase (glutamine-hydrolysing)
MCGLAGFFSPLGGASEMVCREMADTLRLRGPDDGGVWVDQNAGVALGHRRLSIQDLSPLGHQPMESPSARYVIAYNGEIYNFHVLQKELERQGNSFRGHSDTEVLLAAVEKWGVERALTKFMGMFAFALWDKKERVLTLARDRIGEKPLYYGWQRKSFLFASELKALKVHPDWRGEINRDALSLYMRHNYIPAPYSIYQGIYKLMPGTVVQVPSTAIPATVIEPKPYWQAKEVAESGVANPLSMSDDEAVESLDRLLRSSIQEKMISDVPLGAFLSGGIDSSLIVALMQQESSRPVKTFSIGFHEEGYNEAEHAKAVAAHLGTEHTELYVRSDQAMDVIPKLPILYDEPFSDSSQIPTFLVSEMTKQHVTVALSGDGGDELFSGYNRYFWGQTLWKKLGRIPAPMRSVAGHMIKGVAPSNWDALFRMINPVLPTKFTQPQPGDKLHKLADILTMQSPESMYRDLVSHWKKPEEIVLGGREPLTALTDKRQWADLDGFVQRMQFLDTISYLPDDILVKVDRAAMGVSLETRIPFLDHRVVEFAWRVPMSMKIRDGQGKWILRQALYRYVPQKLIERPKMGFGVPIGAWLRGPLREWAEELLDENRLQQEGFFQPGPIRQKWKEHLSGERNWQYLLWDVLMFQAWHEQWGE